MTTKHLLLIILLISSLLMVGCDSSYRRCFNDCRVIKYQCTWANAIDEVEGNCIDGIGFDIVNSKCYEECRGVIGD